MDNDKHFVNMLSNMIFHNFQSQSKDGYNSTNEKNEALNDLMAAKEEDEELIFYEIQDQSMSFGNAIIIMILFGLIANTFLLIARTEKDSSTSKRDLILNLFYSGCYLPFTYWVSQSHGTDCLCRMKNCISMLLLMLTHFIVLDYLSLKFIETLKSLNSTQASKDMSIMLIPLSQLQSQCNSPCTKPVEKQTFPARKWQFIYLISLALSLPELFIWKWCKRKEQCYLPSDPAKSKQYVAYLLFIKYLLPITIVLSLCLALFIKFVTRCDKLTVSIMGSPCQKSILTTCYAITFLPIYRAPHFIQFNFTTSQW